MKATVNKQTELNFTHLKLKCGARYWEDATVNGIEDEEGDLIPLRIGDYWCPTIDLETGIIKDWTIGTTADVHYKCCDDGEYWLIADNGEEVKYKGYYVPSILDFTREGYGDYVIMKIDENGKILNWKQNPDIQSFLDYE